MRVSKKETLVVWISAIRIRWDTLGESMGKTMVALKAALPTSTKFWLCLIVIIGGLAGSLIRGGPEGFAAAVAALTLYCGTKAYQNVKFAKLNKRDEAAKLTKKIHIAEARRSTGTVP